MSVEIVFPPSCEQFIQLQCNGQKFRYINPPEADIIDPYLRELNPNCVLDMGCGIGRIGVYLFKKYEWKYTRFILADGDSGEKQLAGMRTGKDDFYNSMAVTYEFCEANGMSNVELLNLEEQGWSAMQSVPNLVVSFYAFGFHWPIDYFLDSIYLRLGESCLLLFGMRVNANETSREWHNSQMQAVDRAKYRMIDLVYGVAINMLVLERI